MGAVGLAHVARRRLGDRVVDLRAPRRSVLKLFGHVMLMPPVRLPVPDRRRCTARPRRNRRRGAAARGRASRGSAPPRRRADGPVAIAPPFGLTFSGSSPVHSPMSARHCEANASLSSTTADVLPADAGALERDVGRLHGRDPEHVGIDRRAPRGRRSAPAAPGPAASAPSSSAISIAPAPSFSGDELPAVTVPSFDERRLELGQLLERRVGPHVLVALELGARHRDHPLAVEAALPRRARALVAAQRELVLRLTRDRRRCRPASRRSAPSEIVHCSGIFGLTIRHPSVLEYSCSCSRGERALGLEQDPRRAAHRLDAADEHDRRVAASRSSGWPASPRRGSSRTGG